jgi:hypothetical protein
VAQPHKKRSGKRVGEAFVLPGIFIGRVYMSDPPWLK